jgi:pyruvate kinase
MKKTKIVATIGPASMSKQKLKKMVEAGMNVCRLNFSHSDHAWHRKAIQNIRAVEKTTKQRVGILGDLQGPRIRIANEKSLKLKESEKIFLTDVIANGKKQGKRTIIFDWDDFYKYVTEGDKIFIEDGLIQLQVVSVSARGCIAKVIVAGEAKPYKAVNIPAISPHMKALTEKDLRDLEFMVQQQVDMIAVSFVGNANDLKKVRKVVEYFIENKKIVWHRKGQYKGISKGGVHRINEEYYPWIIPKIERRLAVKNIVEIIKQSDGIMIARGDLAVEMAQEKVAILEKDIIKKVRRTHKPVIVATQMLASMEKNNRPTRAEISDVTNAVIDHADAVMLSGESAMGKYPVVTIDTMARIIEITEKSKYDDIKLKRNKWSKIIFGEEIINRKTKTAQDLKRLLQYSSLRQEKLKLKMSKKKLDDWGKASLVWGVNTSI